MIEQLKKLKHYKLLTPTPLFWQELSERRREAGCDSDKHRFHERLVFSFLAYRSQLAQGASIRQICRETRLHPQTVRTALLSLGNLVRQDRQRWIAVEPPENWFRPRIADQPAKHWSDSLAYTMMFLPRRGAKIQYRDTSRRFGINHAAVYSFLVSRGRKCGWTVRKFTFAGQAKMLGIDPKTVRAVIEDLHYAGLIEREDLGRCSDITLLSLTAEHLKLYEPVAAPVRRKVVPVEKQPRNIPAAYEFRGDKWDIARRLCEGLMPQKQAEAVIEKARRLGETPEDFEAQFNCAKHQHEKNVLSGKIGKGNYGNYLNTRYQTRLDELERHEREEQARLQQEAYYRSPEYQQRQAEERKLAAADPLHPMFIADERAVLARVSFAAQPLANIRGLDRLKDKLHRHVRAFVSKKHLPTQQEIDLTGDLKSRIMKRALSAVNRYYDQPTLATPAEFEEAIDAAILSECSQMGPLFAAASEVRHAC